VIIVAFAYIGLAALARLLRVTALLFGLPRRHGVSVFEQHHDEPPAARRHRETGHRHDGDQRNPRGRDAGVSFIALIFTGIPVAWALAGVSILFSFIAIYGFEWFGWDTYFLTDMRIFGVFVQRIWGQMSNWILVALPMFIFMGLMLERSGVTEKLMSNFIQLFGRFRGGLALGVVLIGILLAASTGIVGASVVLLAMLSMPIMLQQGYNKGFASGVVASAGTLGILIPPSIMLIIMADQMSVSVGNLFMGALFPGLMLGASTSSSSLSRRRCSATSPLRRPTCRR
jgi:tripartite ATP-independent transporter DctM subunit